MIESAKALYETVGFIRGSACGICHLYNRSFRSRVGPRPGQSVVRYNGVRVYDNARQFDTVVPFAGDRPYYEHALIKAIRDHVEPGNSVVHVGGGFGVSAAVSANHVSTSGTVTVFEGAGESVGRIHETAHLNSLDANMTVEHAIVSDVENLRGESCGAPTLPPVDLPASDVLVLDCEGAEAEIVPDLSTYPPILIVETHGELDAPPDLIEREVLDAGYDILEKLPAHGAPDRRGQFVLVGRKTARPTSERPSFGGQWSSVGGHRSSFGGHHPQPH